MPKGKQIKGGAEGIVGKTIASAQLQLNYLAIQFADDSYWIVKAASRNDDFFAHLETVKHPSPYWLHSLGIFTEEERDAASYVAAEKYKAKAKAERRAAYKRLKEEFEAK